MQRYKMEYPNVYGTLEENWSFRLSEMLQCACTHKAAQRSLTGCGEY